MENIKLKLEPFHSEMKAVDEANFIMKVWGKSPKGKRNHEITLLFKNWWIKYIYSDLLKVISEQKQKIEELETALKTGNVD